ncbi:response regulator transcription factor [Chryseolinea sp. T2]|uniref:response regulator transcription factor n=1 Tax=Chryseolinea sp. T2 TaxID=3129255 RepID=UPI003076DD9A
MIRLVIAEDHNALIDGIKLFLEHEKDIQFVGYANNGHELCDLVRLKQPNVVVTDIRMPVMDGITATPLLLKIDPSIKIIAFTMFDQDDAVQQMLNAGAKGYILKNSNLTELIAAVRAVSRGEQYYDSNIVIPTTTTSKGKGLLSRRQIEILKLVALGKTNQEIADQLFIGKTTVETHRKNMIRILNLKGAGELLRYAIESKYKF